MAESKADKRLKKPECDPVHGIKRDTRRDAKRKRFGLKITEQWRRSDGYQGKSYTYTRWYQREDQRDEALRTEDAKGSHGWPNMEVVRTFENVER